MDWGGGGGGGDCVLGGGEGGEEVGIVWYGMRQAMSKKRTQKK